MAIEHFLHSSLSKLPARDFKGYCFRDADLVTGAEGYRSFSACRQSTIEPGEDGCYVILNSTESETVIGTDFSGYSKLFLYRHGPNWAVSNSFIALAEFASMQQWPVTIDDAHLAGFFIQGPFGNQLTSLHTSVEQIRLIPASQELVIRHRPGREDELVLRRTSAARRIDDEKIDYREALSRFIATWSDRLHTLLGSDMDLISELTGGRDSRSVLALFLCATRDAAGQPGLDRVMFRSNERSVDDLAVARSLASAFSLRLNDPSVLRHPQRRLSATGSYEMWKQLNLGIYTPIYFPTGSRHPGRMLFGGVGGEGHRAFYKVPGIEWLLDTKRPSFPSPVAFAKFREDVITDLSSLATGYERNVDPLLLHYRYFRERCHGGRMSQYAYMSAPLGSHLLRHASTLCSEQDRQRSQVLNDVMMNASLDLAMHPYDRPEKLPDAEHLARFCDVGGAMAGISRQGKVFRPEASPAHGDGANPQPSQWSQLAAEVAVQAERLQADGLFTRDQLDAAIRTTEAAASSGRLSHAVDGILASHVLLAGRLSALAR